MLVEQGTSPARLSPCSLLPPILFGKSKAFSYTVYKLATTPGSSTYSGPLAVKKFHSFPHGALSPRRPSDFLHSLNSSTVLNSPPSVNPGSKLAARGIHPSLSNIPTVSKSNLTLTTSVVDADAALELLVVLRERVGSTSLSKLASCLYSF